MFKNLTICFVLTLMMGTFAGAQTSAADKAAFKAFFSTFKAAVAKGDKLAVAKLTNFPFYDRTGEVFDDANKLECKDQKQFLAKYDLIFTKSVKAAIATGKPYTRTSSEENEGGGGPEVGDFQLDNDNAGDDRQAPLYFKKIRGKYRLVGITYNP